MTVRPIIFSGPMVNALLAGRKSQTRRLATSPLAKCQPGDLLYVRERLECRSSVPRLDDAATVELALCAFYAAGPDLQPAVHAWPGKRPYGSIPSIHMPRALSRLTLEVTEVRRQRLRDISDGDALAEGIDGSVMFVSGQPVKRFGELWASLHGEASWEANPDVVAISFMVHRQNVDALLEGKVAA